MTDDTYDAVVFDNDGVLTTLVDRAILRTAAAETFAAFDVDPAPEDVDRVTVGVSPDDLATVCDRYDLSPEAFWRLRDETSSRAQIDAVHRGEKRLYDDIDAVEAIDLPLGVVSSNQQATLDFLFDHFAIDSWFGTVHGREPTPESLALKKPATHYVERALESLAVDADRTLFVGDTWVDVVAGDRAGCDTAFVRRPHRRDHTVELPPTYEVETLDELLALDRVPVRSETAR
ncbi:HAD family hydrolase [Salinigranum halophilum]|uniref:HAD family hydrolase n=1 Tax=Salinigranum halophilum TaxID=2565931 RepID=UPI0010A8D827|nr:HAD-IA family hydrolase [Salinigranum halophilum]